MAFPPDDEKDKKKKPPADDAAPDAEGGAAGDDLFDEEDIVGEEGAADTGEGADEGDVKSPIPNPDDQDHAELISKAAAVLAEHTGLTIEPSEDPWEFLRHIITAAATHSATKSKMASDQGGQQTGANGQGDQATEEQRPYLMSTDGAKIELSATIDMPLEKIAPQHQVAARLYRDRAKNVRENRLKIIDKLEKAGVPREKLQPMREECAGYLLSLDAIGGVVTQPLDEKLRIWLDAAKHFGGAKLLSTMTGAKLPKGAKEMPRQCPTSNEGLEALAKKRAEAVSVRQK